MKYSVLVVDDSVFLRRRLKDIIEQDARLEVIDEASNGKEAIAKVKARQPALITMDVEMPIMDGIAAVKHIMRDQPTPILMFSSLTSEGAKHTLDALDAGALDFLPKEFSHSVQIEKGVGLRLRRKILSLVRHRKLARMATVKVAQAPHKFMVSDTMKAAASSPKVANVSAVKKSNKRYQCLAIGSSTGGPVALQKTLGGLPAHFPYPVFLVQHMPGTFTEAFAKRLNQSCQINVKLAEHGESVQPGTAYLAPGGRQMQLTGTRSACKISITDADDDGSVLYKPSVNVTFADIARVYTGDVLALILTGMGNDGQESCSKLKRLGATIWAQDEQTSVVYGMPGAVTKANLVDFNMPLESICSCIKTEML